MSRISTINNRNLQTASIDHVMGQIQWGFQPHWLLTYHYGNPYERGWRVIETSRRWGYRVPHDHSLWNVVDHDKSLTARRNDPILVSRDARHIRNLMLQHAWGIQGDLRVHDRATTPMLFVHEKGLQRLQYHTHMLIGELPEPWTTPQAIRKLWRQHILPRARCLSRTNSFHIEPVYSPRGIAGYLSKEIKSTQIAVDYTASCFSRANQVHSNLPATS